MARAASSMGLSKCWPSSCSEISRSRPPPRPFSPLPPPPPPLPLLLLLLRPRLRPPPGCGGGGGCCGRRFWAWDAMIGTVAGRLVGAGAWKGGEGRLLRPLAWDWVLEDAMEEAGEQARAPVAVGAREEEAAEVGREEAGSRGALLGAEAEALCVLLFVNLGGMQVRKRPAVYGK